MQGFWRPSLLSMASVLAALTCNVAFAQTDADQAVVVIEDAIDQIRTHYVDEIDEEKIRRIAIVGLAKAANVDSRTVASDIRSIINLIPMIPAGRFDAPTLVNIAIESIVGSLD